MTFNIRYLVIQVINFMLALVVFFLGFRIIFQLFGANPQTPFVQWIYSVSSRLMAPFMGIFPNIDLGGGSSLDVVALLSLVAYGLIAQIAISLISTAASSTTITQTRTS